MAGFINGGMDNISYKGSGEVNIAERSFNFIDSISTVMEGKKPDSNIGVEKLDLDSVMNFNAKESVGDFSSQLEEEISSIDNKIAVLREKMATFN